MKYWKINKMRAYKAHEKDRKKIIKGQKFFIIINGIIRPKRIKKSLFDYLGAVAKGQKAIEMIGKCNWIKYVDWNGQKRLKLLKIIHFENTSLAFQYARQFKSALNQTKLRILLWFKFCLSIKSLFYDFLNNFIFFNYRVSLFALWIKTIVRTDLD